MHYANMMGLKSRKGTPVSTNTMYYMLDNPFYYGEMRTFRGVMPHVYTPIITKDLWDLCQQQKTLRAGLIDKYSPKPFLFKGMVTCGITNRTCPCELKRQCFLMSSAGKMTIQEFIRERKSLKSTSVLS